MNISDPNFLNGNYANDFTVRTEFFEEIFVPYNELPESTEL